MYTSYEGHSLASNTKKPEVGGIWPEVGGKALSIFILLNGIVSFYVIFMSFPFIGIKQPQPCKYNPRRHTKNQHGGSRLGRMEGQGSSLYH